MARFLLAKARRAPDAPREAVMKVIVGILLVGAVILGFYTSASLGNASLCGWTFRRGACTAAANLALASIVNFIASESTPTSRGYRMLLSPGGWIFGTLMSYTAGFVAFWFAE